MQNQVYKVSIPAGGSFSTAIDVSNTQPVSLQFPSSWTAAQLSVQVSHDGDEWFDAYYDGSEYLIPAGASRHCDVNLNIAGIQYLRFRSGTSASPVNQTAKRVITGVKTVVG